MIRLSDDVYLPSLHSMAHLVEISSAELTFFQVQVQIFHHKKTKYSLFSGLGAKALHFFQIQGSLSVTKSSKYGSSL